MLDCQRCWRRCLRALLTSQSARSPTMYTGSRLTAPRLRRLFSTATSRTAFAGPGLLTRSRGRFRPGLVTEQDRQAFKRTPRAQSSEIQSSDFDFDTANSTSASNLSRFTIPADPAKLALQTKKLLLSAGPDTSPESRLIPLTFVRAATSEHKTNPTAAWNELISHAMATGDVSGAYKHLNDMKKRGCPPNDHTYTILLSGLALPQNAKFPSSLPRALATYRALKERDRDTKGGIGKAEWNLIHTNAILKVCSRMGATEEMWQIVGDLPEEGPKSADARTYTSLLNGLRQMRGPGGRPRLTEGVDWDPEMLNDTERQKIEETVDDAERMWGGLLTRWSRGKVMVDDELICAMARMRLSSTRARDWQKVFSLMEEVLRIPNFYAGNGQAPPPEDGNTRWKPPGTPKAGAATLSVLLQAAEHVHANPAVGTAYWDYFTTQLKVHPDLEDHVQYLRFLRRSRDGNTAATVIGDMVKKAVDVLNTQYTRPGSDRPRDRKSASQANTHLPPLPTQKCFIIALSCCKRLTTSGKVTSASKHSYMYESALRILSAFDSLYTALSSPSLPIPRPATDGSPASYHYQYPGQAIKSRETACKVYAAFLDTANVLTGQDPQVAKQALKRATTPLDDKKSKDPSRRAMDHTNSHALPPHLPTLINSSKAPPPEVLDFAKALLRLATATFEDSRATWGHGERAALRENTQMLKEILSSRPGFTLASDLEWKTPSTSTPEPSSPEPWNAKYLNAKQREATRDSSLLGGKEENEEDSAAAWGPSSARDRGAKRMEAWGKRASAGAVGKAGKFVHYKPELDDSKNSRGRREPQSGARGRGENGFSNQPPRERGEQQRGELVKETTGTPFAVNRFWDGNGQPPAERAPASRVGGSVNSYTRASPSPPALRPPPPAERASAPRVGGSVNSYTRASPSPPALRPPPPAERASAPRVGGSVNSYTHSSPYPPALRAPPPAERAAAPRVGGSVNSYTHSSPSPPALRPPPPDSLPGMVTPEERRINRNNRGDDQRWATYAHSLSNGVGPALRERSRGKIRR